MNNEERIREELIGKVSPETYHKNYLAEAGAGAGKTSVMVNRIANGLLSGELQPEHLAAITFTEKATQEMVARIDSELLRRQRESDLENGPDSSESARLKELRGSTDQMQVSTIHSFCQKMLMTMPYESPLGPEFEVREDIETYAGEFFDRTIAEDPSLFDRARKVTGVSYADLKHNFLRLCESNAELVCAECTDETIDAALEAQRQPAKELFRLVAENGDPCNYKSKKYSESLPKFNEILRLVGAGEETFVSSVCRTLNPLASYPSFKDEDIEHLMPRKSKKNTSKDDARDCMRRIGECWQDIIHMLCISAIKELIISYQAYKRKNRVASQNDLLICARDMLRTSTEARTYFHNRYRTVFVDEMQDTDPVQAQILFYLTTDDAHFDADDWRNCRPVPGSLFLVGDPKQAIYRFRGADYSVYSTVERLFEGGLGEVVHLHFNYRSSSEITDFADKVFADIMTGDACQPTYSPMAAVHGTSSHARITEYCAAKEADPQTVAAFISETVSAGTIVGVSGNEHSAKYADFMILTRTNARTEEYVRALAKFGIPCNMAGSRNFSDVQPIVRAGRILRHLTDRRDETKLAEVLTNCCGITLPTLRRYRQRAGKLTAPWLPVKKALMAEGAIPAEFEQIFRALEELDGLAHEVGRLPALTVIEDVCFKSSIVWKSGDPSDRSGDYSMVCQFLGKLRAGGYRTFPELADDAVKLSEGQTERELLLEEKEDCVRVMTLHKAKGLEAEIVILAYDSPFRSDAEKHVFYEGNLTKMHCRLTRDSGHGRDTVLVEGPGWNDENGPKAKEEAHLTAEVQRILYVAATRAKTCLFYNTCSGGAWSQLAKPVPVSEEDGSDAEEFEDEPEPYTDEDPCWQRAIRVLNSGECGAANTAEKDLTAAAISAGSLEEQLCAAAKECSDCQAISVTPSMLELHQKKPLRREDEDPSEESTPVESEFADIPHGADWGTIVHRVMELSVKNEAYSADAIAAYARQAVSEVLGEDPVLTAGQQALLLGTHTLSADETLTGYLTERVLQTAAFLTDPQHPLRVLLDGAAHYTELPFILQENDPGTPLADSVYRFAGAGHDRPINMNGVIDLAVYDSTGWTVIDYKTDLVRKDETESDYIARLKLQYTPQLLAYREVLNRLGKGSVTNVSICALSLGGMLISIL